MKYSPQPAPQDPEDLARYIYSEVRKIQQVLELVDSSAQYVRVESVSHDFAMAEWSNVVFVDSSATATTITLPQPYEGRRVTVKKVVAANTVTLVPNGSETIDGATSHVLSALNVSVSLVSDDTPNWKIV